MLNFDKSSDFNDVHSLNKLSILVTDKVLKFLKSIVSTELHPLNMLLIFEINFDLKSERFIEIILLTLLS